MNLGDLIEEYRIVADDNAEPPQCSDNEIRMYLNQAQVEACRRGHGIIDSATTSICQINTVINTVDYAIDPRVISIRRATIPSKQNKPIYPIKASIMDMYMPNWEGQTGSIDAFVIGLNTNMVRLFRNPTEVQTIQLTVMREPLVKMVQPSDVPELQERYHHALVHWALHRAYSKINIDVEEDEKSAKHLKAFEAEFGTRDDANAKEEAFLANCQGFLFNTGAR